MSRTYHHQYKQRRAGWEHASRMQRPSKGSKEHSYERNWQVGDEE